VKNISPVYNDSISIIAVRNRVIKEVKYNSLFNSLVYIINSVTRRRDKAIARRASRALTLVRIKKGG